MSLKKEKLWENQCGQFSAGDWCTKYDDSSYSSKIDDFENNPLREIVQAVQNLTMRNRANQRLPDVRPWEFRRQDILDVGD